MELPACACQRVVVLFLDFEDGAWDRVAVVRVQAFELLDDLVGFVPRERADRGLAVEKVGAAGARNEPASGRGDDCHGVGVAEGVAAALVGDESFEEREHHACAGRDDARVWREEVPAGLLGCGGLGCELVESVDGDVGSLIAGLLVAVHLGVDAVVGGVAEHLQEAVESFALRLADARLAGHCFALFD